MTRQDHEENQWCSNRQRIIVRLYVMGEHNHSRESVLTVKQLCEGEFGVRYDLTTIDLTVNSERSSATDILVTPTLVRVCPGPERRCVGDLSDSGAMRLVLQSWLEEVGCHCEC